MVFEEMPRAYKPIVPPGRLIEDMKRQGYDYLYNICHETDGNMRRHAEHLGCNPEELRVVDGIYMQDPAYARFGALFVRSEMYGVALKRKPLIHVSHAANGFTDHLE
jgi:hypothetical protein